MLSSVAQARSQAVDRIFNKVDSDRDGKITRDELAQALASDRAQSNSSGQQAGVDQVFSLLDTGNKGYITRQDTANGLDKVLQLPGEAAPAASDGGPAKRPSRPPAGTGGGGGGAPPPSNVSTDPADTNQDGKVSMQEEIAYVLKQYQQTESMQPFQSAIYA
jgi:Ca2+-binding EF-hand superfamily protein